MNAIEKLVDKAEFAQLFIEELGWNNPDAMRSWTAPTGELLTQIANFKGLRVWVHRGLPEASRQGQIDSELAKESQERLIIFHDENTQHWRWPRHRAMGVNAKLMNHTHVVGNAEPSFLDKLKAIEIGFDENLTLVDLLKRMRGAFDKETETASQQAARLMGTLFDKLEKAKYPEDAASALLARLLFLFFGDDTDMWKKNAFHTWLQEHTTTQNLPQKLAELFDVLNDARADNALKGRPWELSSEFSDFRYVNGNVFSGDLELKSVDASFRTALLEACDFNWSIVSPAVFGSMFQTVKSSTARRKMGEHYTTEQNIMKLIRPLFLDELEERLERAWDSKGKLTKLHNHLGTLRFLDPACGCGNFLVVTYRELRRLELNLIVRREELDVQDNNYQRSQGAFQFDFATESKVRLDHFFGIEINEWPASIARTAMLLVDHQENQAMSSSLGEAFVRLPIRESATIETANALRADWHKIFRSEGTKNYIIGNPPFLGDNSRSKEQAEDFKVAWGGAKTLSRLDFVTAWHAKTLNYFEVSGVDGEWAYVTTNSITQGDQVPRLFGEILGRGWNISFAHRTFAWSTEAMREAAAVHCVIVGFSRREKKQRLFVTDARSGDVSEAPLRVGINAYLLDAKNILVEKRSSPMSDDVALTEYGSKATDDGNLIVEQNELEEVMKDRVAAKYLRPYVGAKELLKGDERWCLWLRTASLDEIKSSAVLSARVDAVKNFRSRKEAPSSTREYPYHHLFRQIADQSTSFVCIPRVTTENRLVLPSARLEAFYIASDSTFQMKDPEGIGFSLLSSRMFMAWQKAIGGRLKSDIRFASTLTWYTFPVPALDASQRARIIEAGAGVLAARELEPDKTLAQHYDPKNMAQALLDAHDALDREIDAVFGATDVIRDESERQRILFDKYAELIAAEQLQLDQKKSRTRRK